MKPVVAVTIGDINGVGPEIVLKAVRSKQVTAICRPVLVGPWSVFEFYARRLRLRVPRLWLSEPAGGRRVTPTPGAVRASAGAVAESALRHAVSLAASGFADAVVTAPVSKDAMMKAGVRFPGQTEFLKKLTGSRTAGMMLVSPSMRVGLVTIHIPVRTIGSVLSAALLRQQVDLFHESLRTDWGIRKPRLAVLGLNPHAGEQGRLGNEEQTIITPALRALRRKGINVSGPFPADSFFARKHFEGTDAVIAMYHDQGLIPLKMMADGLGVNVTVGLPIVRTSPDHGTGFDIAGKGVADPRSMIRAIDCAVRISRRRKGKR